MVDARPRPPVTLTRDQRSTLQRWVRARTTPQRLVLRSAIVLLAAEGLPPGAIAKRLGTSRSTVRLWCQRFTAGGPPVLARDAPGRGRKPRVSAAAIARVREAEGAHVSIRELARRLGSSPGAICRALARNGNFGHTGDEG